MPAAGESLPYPRSARHGLLWSVPGGTAENPGSRVREGCRGSPAQLSVGQTSTADGLYILSKSYRKTDTGYLYNSRWVRMFALASNLQVQRLPVPGHSCGHPQTSPVQACHVLITVGGVGGVLNPSAPRAPCVHSILCVVTQCPRPRGVVLRAPQRLDPGPGQQWGWGRRRFFRLFTACQPRGPAWRPPGDMLELSS